MSSFLSSIQHQLSSFMPFASHKVRLDARFFGEDEMYVKDAIKVIELTASQLASQQNLHYAEIYSERLYQQFASLQQAISRLRHHTQTQSRAFFRSDIRIPKRLQHLPRAKQIPEYQKILRALNDKLSWLSERAYYAESTEEKAVIAQQIQETEARKQRCIARLDHLQDTR